MTRGTTLRVRLGLMVGIATLASVSQVHAQQPQVPAADEMARQMTQMAGQQASGLVKFWGGMVFGPKSFREAHVPNPEAEPNMISISAYTPSLSDKDMVEMAMAKRVLKWGKRGDIGLYFPMGLPDGNGQHFLFGEAAETYIRRGGMLNGISTVGMPVDDYGSATMGKNVAAVNFKHALAAAKKSSVFQRAMAKIASKRPELKQAARTFDLGNAELRQELTTRAGGNPRLARAMLTLMKQISSPTAFVVNSGFTSNEDGGVNYLAKRRANELGQPSGDKIVAEKMAGLLHDWWKAVLPSARELDPKIFSANHCAGAGDDSDWLFALERKLKRENPELLKQVMRRTYSYDLGAALPKPAGVRHLASIGTAATDMFGLDQTPTKVIARVKHERATHMLNEPLGRLNPDGVPSLKIKPFAKAFGIRLYDQPQDSTLPPRVRAQRRAKALSKLASHFGKMASKQKGMLDHMKRESPPEAKVWVTYQASEANLVGNQKIYQLKQQRALALAKIATLKAKGASGAELTAAWRQAKQLRVQQKQAEREMESRIATIGLRRNIATDAVKYQVWTHGGQASAQQRFLQKKGPAYMQRYQERSQRYGQAAGQMLVNTYGRAKGALQAVDQQIAAPRR